MGLHYGDVLQLLTRAIHLDCWKQRLKISQLAEFENDTS